MEKKEKIADDILVGARAIADEIGFSERRVYAKQRDLGLKHLGSLLVGSRIELRKRLSSKEA